MPLQIHSKILIIGAGRVGTALSVHLQKHTEHQVHLWNRREVVEPIHNIEYKRESLSTLPLQNYDWLILAIKDDALPSLIKKLEQRYLDLQTTLITHCSGRTPLNVFNSLADKGARVGIHHPLMPITEQTHRQKHKLFKGIHVGLDGEESVQAFLAEIIEVLGGKSFDLAGIDRDLYHTAAVFSSNYLVTLLFQASELLGLSGITEEKLPLLLPLAEAALANLRSVGLPNALTGPIARSDLKVIRSHSDALAQSAPHLKELYLKLAQKTLPIVEQLQKENDQDLEKVRYFLDCDISEG